MTNIEQRKKYEQKILEYSKLSNTEVLKKFDVTMHGYNNVTVRRRIKKYGHNELSIHQKEAWYEVLLKSILNPFVILLSVIAIVSFFTDIVFAAPNEKSWMTIVIIFVIILIGVSINFFEEMKSRKSADKLKSVIKVTTSVIRNRGNIYEIKLRDIIPGDILNLSSGDTIPADIRILECKDLFVDQSSLTGESEPIEKYSTYNENKNSIIELSNICLMGTNIISGTLIGVVLSTGDNTYFGDIATSVATTKPPTSFDKGINKVTGLLIKFTVVMVPIVFLINLFTKGSVLNSLLFAITVAVGTSPELLPVIVTSNLAKGSIKLYKKKIIVKNLNSIQNFGAMDVLCTDKTGTLTQNHIILERYLDPNGEEDVSVLKYAYFNSHFQTGFKNLLDIAIIEKGQKSDIKETLKSYKKVDEIPFDFMRRRLSVVIEDDKGIKQLITKGAFEEMISICKYAIIDNKRVEITNEMKKKFKETINDLNTNGLRVITVAYKNENIHGANEFDVNDESNMTLIGYVAFLDPPKESAKASIKSLKEYGVSIKVITGDNELVTKKICEDVGINIDNILLGKDIETMDDNDLKDKIEKTSIFARISPVQKSKIIKLLQNNGHTVGYMGDGINDAIALRESDVSISVDTAVDVAKESSDIILLEKSLMVLNDGVREGRIIFGNMMKYIKMATSSNVGNMLSVLIACMFLPFLPILPIQILVQNLLYDFSQTSIPFDKVDDEFLLKPQVWNTKGLSRFIFWLAPVSSIFDIITFLVLWYFIGANTMNSAPLFHTGWFIMGLLSQTIIIHIIRTSKIPLIQSRASRSVIVSTLIVSIIGIILPFTKVGYYIGLVHMPSIYFLWLLIIMIGYSLLTQVIKNIYIKKYNEWL